ncbi:MAG: hypothetical protein HYT12_02385 [Candidatus Liptonbacteria bacterium]|nr:hypothetical protein [Candidatus Liptonbacteria bacterium]
MTQRDSAVALIRPKTLSGYQEMFGYIYGKVNKKYSDDALFRRLGEEISKLMEIARKDYRRDFLAQLPRIYSWWNAFASRKRIVLQEALWHKYPGVCGHCLREQNCTCGVEHPDISKEEKESILRRLRRDHANREPFSISDHQSLHARLYKQQNARIMPIQIAAHVSEEWGEISEEDRHGNWSGICNEMADVASWIFALATRLEISVEGAVWNLYPYECEKCHKDVCECKGVV